MAGNPGSDARLGQTLGRYTLVSVLGTGGMATVYEGVHRTGNRVAVKVLHAHLVARRDVRERFVKEGYTSNAIGHPGVVRALDDDTTEDGTPYLVLELLEGETLEAMRRRLGVLPAEEALETLHTVLDAIARAHERGVVHRDLKPENLFRTTEGRIKILDFGIARVLDAEATKTRTGARFGTPAFMAPEQAQGRVDAIDARTDLWALGATAFALVSGRLVHEADTPELVAVAAATQRARSVRTVAPELPERVADVLDRALAFERDERFRTAREMQDALAQAFQEAYGHPIAPPSAAPIIAPSEPVDRASTTVLPAPTLAGLATRESTQPPLQRARLRAVVGVALTLTLTAGLAAFIGVARVRSVGSSASFAPAPGAVSPAHGAEVSPAPTSPPTPAPPAPPAPAAPKVAHAPAGPPGPVLRVTTPAPPAAHAPGPEVRGSSDAAPTAAPLPSAKPSCEPWYFLTPDSRKQRKPWC